MSINHWDIEDGVYHRNGWRIEPWGTADSIRGYTVFYGTTQMGEFTALREAWEWAEDEARKRDAAIARRVSDEIGRWL